MVLITVSFYLEMASDQEKDHFWETMTILDVLLIYSGSEGEGLTPSSLGMSLSIEGREGGLVSIHWELDRGHKILLHWET